MPQHSDAFETVVGVALREERSDREREKKKERQRKKGETRERTHMEKERAGMGTSQVDDVLPNEMLAAVFSWLPTVRDLGSACQVSRRW